MNWLACVTNEMANEMACVAHLVDCASQCLRLMGVTCLIWIQCINHRAMNHTCKRVANCQRQHKQHANKAATPKPPVQIVLPAHPTVVGCCNNVAHVLRASDCCKNKYARKRARMQIRLLSTVSTDSTAFRLNGENQYIAFGLRTLHKPDCWFLKAEFRFLASVPQPYNSSTATASSSKRLIVAATVARSPLLM